VKVLALITARGGSKRIPDKNLRPFGGVPLVVWSIEVARGLPEICDLMVSTDDPAIAKVVTDAGALVPWLRPPELATDEATSVDVCIHALDWYEMEYGVVDGLLLLQPTSPLRTRDTVERGLGLFRDLRRPVIAVSPAQSHPLLSFRLEGDTMRPLIDGAGLPPRSQDLPPAYTANGSLYLISPSSLRSRRALYADDMMPLIVERPDEGIDIDTEWDWMIAEAALAARGSL